MADFFHISEAAAIGSHACMLLSLDPDKSLSARDISNWLGVSYDHTVRVMHRLRQGGILKSVRGPSGGFLLVRDPGELRALEVLEALDGKVEDKHCFFINERCQNECVFFGDIRRVVNRQMRDFFSQLTLQELAARMRSAGVTVERGCERARHSADHDESFECPASCPISISKENT